jgi:O-antigen/teichoic acid export membrane protein
MIRQITDGRKKTHLALVDQAFVSAINFGTGLLLARFLGMSGYGKFVLAYGIILFASGIQMAFISSPMMTIGPAKPESEKDQYYCTTILQQLVFSVLLTFLTLVLCWSLDLIMPEWNLGDIQWALCFALNTFLIQDFWRRLFFVKDKPFNAFINDFISYGLQAATLIIFAIYFQLTATTTLWILGATSLLATCYALATYLNNEKWLTPHKTQILNYISEHWHNGKWLMGQSIVYWAGPQFILYLAAIMLSVSAVGAIAAARNIVGLVNILFSALENLVPSRAAKILHHGGKTALSKYLKRVSIIGGSLTLAISCVASIAPELWLKLLYGNEYTGYGWIVIAWSVYFIIGFFHRPLSAGLRATNMTRILFSSNLIGTLTAITISYPAINIAGTFGVLLALCITQAVILALLYWHYSQRILTPATSNKRI